MTAPLRSLGASPCFASATRQLPHPDPGVNQDRHLARANSVALPEEPEASAWTVNVESMRPLYPMHLVLLCRQEPGTRSGTTVQ